MSWSVGEVATLAGVTVRALHHYDEIGLVVPGGRTPAGHRRYEPADLERLQSVLFYRELGFGLDQVAALLDEGSDPIEHLRRQHGLLAERAGRLQRMAEAVAATIRAREAGLSLTPEEMFEVFGDFDPVQYADEAEERWGRTEAYARSRRRTAAYTKDDWTRVAEEGKTVELRFAELLAAGMPPDGAEAMAAAEEHRAQITRNFYDCGYPIHRGLAAMYLEDPRFTQHYEDIAPGLAQYVHDALIANADRAEGAVEG